MGKSTYQQSKKGIMKYLNEKTDHIGMTVPKGTKDRWRQAAEAQGVSMTKYVCEAVDRRIAAEELFGSTTREDA